MHLGNIGQRLWEAPATKNLARKVMWPYRIVSSLGIHSIEATVSSYFPLSTTGKNGKFIIKYMARGCGQERSPGDYVGARMFTLPGAMSLDPRTDLIDSVVLWKDYISLQQTLGKMRIVDIWHTYWSHIGLGQHHPGVYERIQRRIGNIPEPRVHYLGI